MTVSWQDPENGNQQPVGSVKTPHNPPIKFPLAYASWNWTQLLATLVT